MLPKETQKNVYIISQLNSIVHKPLQILKRIMDSWDIYNYKFKIKSYFSKVNHLANDIINAYKWVSWTLNKATNMREWTENAPLWLVCGSPKNWTHEWKI